MNLTKSNYKLFFYLISSFLLIFVSCSKEKVTIVCNQNSHVRVKFGENKVAVALKNAGYDVVFSESLTQDLKGKVILVGENEDDLIKENNWISPNTGKEGFSIQSNKNVIAVAGADASGTLYGCLEMCEQIEKEKKLPEFIAFKDQPEMVLRGTCIGLQKTEYLPGRGVYEYPYTPENFPWFYDKEQWIEYLDMMVENRFNSLYLWNGHPFASLVKLEDYPYAVEVDDETFRLNEEMFGFITEEANKRGIWVIQMFYNIIVSKPFAEYNGLKTQDRSRPIFRCIYRKIP